MVAKVSLTKPVRDPGPLGWTRQWRLWTIPASMEARPTDRFDRWHKLTRPRIANMRWDVSLTDWQHKKDFSDFFLPASLVDYTSSITTRLNLLWKVTECQQSCRKKIFLLKHLKIFCNDTWMFIYHDLILTICFLAVINVQHSNEQKWWHCHSSDGIHFWMVMCENVYLYSIN